jgi:membrane-associated phospholipid phosphatase
MHMNIQNHSQYNTARGISFLLAFILIGTSLIWGRETVFLLFNQDLGSFADHFFVICSNMAEGWIWIPYLMIVFGYFKKDWQFVFLSFVFSTLLTQIPKQFFFEKITRPFASNLPKSLIHTVTGVEMHTLNSFPSGHTATAFTLFLLTVYLFENKWALILGLIYALLCGYSRVYLGQHFPLDLGGGILAAILSIEISKRIRKI